jgi:transketolase
MGAETGPAADIRPEDRHRAGVARPNPLAGNPGKAPTFAGTVRRADGSSLPVACPTATRLSLACMNMNAVLGGAACHWGGPSAYAELMSAIHGLMFSAADWRAAFNFVNDAGHAENGIYALRANYGFGGLRIEDLKGFRSISSKLTGHGESHLYADGVMVSNGPLGSSLPVAQGLAMGDAVAGNWQRTTLCVISDGAMMEGEAKEAVAAIPGLAGRGLAAPFVMIVSDNNTKLSGRIDAQSFSMQPSFQALAPQGWRVVAVPDGHDLQAVFSAVEKAVADAVADPKRPVALWVKTIKGKGVKKTEQSASGGHGYPLGKAEELRAFCTEVLGNHHGGKLPAVFDAWISEIEAGAKSKADAAAAKAAAAPAAAPAPKKDKVQAGFPKAMIRCADEGLPVVSISADLAGSTGVAPFQTKYPQFSIDVGIAESNMVSAASGMSKLGYLPVVDTFAQFGVTKGALPITMGILSQSPIIGVFSHAGFQDAADGASHQALSYLAMTASIPEVLQYCPASAEEAEWAMEQALRKLAAAHQTGHHADTVLFFCGRENFAVSLKPEGTAYAWGTAMTVADTTAGKSRSVVISANGACVAQAIAAAKALEADGIGAVVLNNATPNRPDVAAHQAALARCGGRLITVEDHQRLGGAGAMLVSALNLAGHAPTRVSILGVDGKFGQSAYTAQELYDLHGIGAKGITTAAKQMA